MYVTDYRWMIKLCKMLKLSNFGGVASDWKSCHKNLPVRKRAQISNITGGCWLSNCTKEQRIIPADYHLYFIYTYIYILSLRLFH